MRRRRRRRACDVDGVQVPGGLPGAQVPGGLPAPNAERPGQPAPEVGLIVKFNHGNGHWEDELGRNWTNAVRFNLPDLDVFAIDADADPPARDRRRSPDVGTVLFNMVVNPVDGKRLRQQHRGAQRGALRGPRATARTHRARPSARGAHHRARRRRASLPRHLNKHIDYAHGYRTAPIRRRQGRQPRHAARHGGRAATAHALRRRLRLEQGRRLRHRGARGRHASRPTPRDHIARQRRRADRPRARRGQRPPLRADPLRQRRLGRRHRRRSTEIAQHRAAQPRAGQRRRRAGRSSTTRASPRATARRRARAATSSATSTASAWDLGNPDDVVRRQQPTRSALDSAAAPAVPPDEGADDDADPARHGAPRRRCTGAAIAPAPTFRSDRSASTRSSPSRPSTSPSTACSGATTARSPTADMQPFTDFILAGAACRPIRSARSTTRSPRAQASGRNFYVNGAATDRHRAHCNGCHTLDPAQGFFGTDGQTHASRTSRRSSRSPHLRNVYQKVGMFGMPDVAVRQRAADNAPHQGDQVRGFGFLHDGSVDTVFRFLQRDGLHPRRRRSAATLEQFMLAFDTDLRADRRPADHADQQQRRDRRRAHRPADRARRPASPARSARRAASATWSSRAPVGGEPRGYLLHGATGSFQQRPRRRAAAQRRRTCAPLAAPPGRS